MQRRCVSGNSIPNEDGLACFDFKDPDKGFHDFAVPVKLKEWGHSLYQHLSFWMESSVGLWDWFKGKPKNVEVIDRVWMNQGAKFRGLCQEVQDQIPNSAVVLVSAHFPATLTRVREALEGYGLKYLQLTGRLSKAEMLRVANNENPEPILVQANALEPDEFPDPIAEELPPFSIILAERHFLPPWDESIAAFGRGLGRRCRLSFHVSLKDPLMEQFAGEWVGQILASLGMTESDPIESPMVSRRIQAAQAKFAKKVTHEQKADSPEEWIQWNVPR